MIEKVKEKILCTKCGEGEAEWDDLCQMCWEEYCDKTWWELCAPYWLEPMGGNQ